MAPFVCHIVPSYLLKAIADGPDAEAGSVASKTLASIAPVHEFRKAYAHSRLASGQHGHLHGPGGPSQGIVPDHLLQDILQSDDVDENTKKQASSTLAFNRQVRDQRAAATKEATPAAAPAVTTASGFTRNIYDLESQVKFTPEQVNITYTLLPGKLVRQEAGPASSDKAVNDVYDNTLKVLKFFETIFGYKSIDGKNMPVKSTVHFGQKLQNASWYGADATTTINQMVYGDGSGDLVNFTSALDVIGHEIMVSAFAVHTLPRFEREEAESDLLSTASRNSTARCCTKTRPGL